jgi:hypothetical protein
VGDVHCKDIPQEVVLHPELIFQNDTIAKKISKCLARRDLQEQKELGMCYDEDIVASNDTNLEVRWVSAQVGRGVFTLKGFRPGEFLGEYTGIVKDSKYSFSDNRYNIAYLRDGRKTYYIDAQHIGSNMRFVNHSDCPNACGIFVMHRGVLKAIFIAWKNIKKGEQLLFNYGPKYWAGLGQEPLPL